MPSKINCGPAAETWNGSPDFDETQKMVWGRHRNIPTVWATQLRFYGQHKEVAASPAMRATMDRILKEMAHAAAIGDVDAFKKLTAGVRHLSSGTRWNDPWSLRIMEYFECRLPKVANVSEISSKTGIDRTTVRKFCDRMGIKRKPGNPKTPKKTRR